MNLLVTNTRNAQAYAIIRALRPYATKIVVTMEGDCKLAARLSHAANSRLVDKRYYCPSPADGWRAGRIRRENTESEEAFIQTVLNICEDEKIDVVFPSFDPHVYVFSKNKQRFETRRILIPIPEYETVVAPLDKYRTIRLAQEAGFPCPKTYLPEDKDHLKEIAKELGFPLVIKPRFTAGGKGTVAASDFAALLKVVTRLKKDGFPLIQEYIPGRRQKHFNLTLGKDGSVKMAFSREVHRFLLPGKIQNAPTVSETVETDPCTTHAAKLARMMGWWGGVTVQTKVDIRDGVSKLMEINPRLGFTLWNRTEVGINEPLQCIKIARGECVEKTKDYPSGTLFISPVEDMLALIVKLLALISYKCCHWMFSEGEIKSEDGPLGLKELLSSYRETYFSRKRKVFSPYFKYVLQDPLSCLLWWCQSFMLTLRGAKQLGR